MKITLLGFALSFIFFFYKDHFFSFVLYVTEEIYRIYIDLYIKRFGLDIITNEMWLDLLKYYTEKSSVDTRIIHQFYFEMQKLIFQNKNDAFLLTLYPEGANVNNFRMLHLPNPHSDIFLSYCNENPFFYLTNKSILFLSKCEKENNLASHIIEMKYNSLTPLSFNLVYFSVFSVVTSVHFFSALAVVKFIT